MVYIFYYSGLGSFKNVAVAVHAPDAVLVCVWTAGSACTGLCCGRADMSLVDMSALVVGCPEVKRGSDAPRQGLQLQSAATFTCNLQAGPVLCRGRCPLVLCAVAEETPYSAVHVSLARSTTLVPVPGFKPGGSKHDQLSVIS